jgi:hypothetical protein
LDDSQNKASAITEDNADQSLTPPFTEEQEARIREIFSEMMDLHINPSISND